MKTLLARAAALTAALLLPLATVPASTATAQAQTLPGWTTTNSSWTNPRATQPMVTNLRYATHAGFDRVVISIDGRIPSWRATYQRHFVYDASGAPVPIRGGIQLVLMARAHDLAGHNVYRGPRLVRPGFDALKAIALTGDFEGHVTFAFGLDPQHTPYRIFRLSSPQRLVIDFKH